MGGFASSCLALCYKYFSEPSRPDSSPLGRARHCTRFSTRGLRPRRAQTTNYVLAFAYLIRGYNVLEEMFRHWVTLRTRPRSLLSASLSLSSRSLASSFPRLFPQLCSPVSYRGINFAFYYIALYYVKFVYYSKILFTKGKKKLIEGLPSSSDPKESFREYPVRLLSLLYFMCIPRTAARLFRAARSRE